MNAIKISASCEIKPVYIEENGKPLYELIRKELDCNLTEYVYPKSFPKNIVMIVDEEGKLKGKPTNNLASVLYESFIHGDFIVGDVLVLKIGEYNGEPDVVGLEDYETERLLKALYYVLDGERS